MIKPWFYSVMEKNQNIFSAKDFAQYWYSCIAHSKDGEASVEGQVEIYLKVRGGQMCSARVNETWAFRIIWFPGCVLCSVTFKNLKKRILSGSMWHFYCTCGTVLSFRYAFVLEWLTQKTACVSWFYFGGEDTYVRSVWKGLMHVFICTLLAYIWLFSKFIWK